jgi:hypothetical protein
MTTKHVAGFALRKPLMLALVMVVGSIEVGYVGPSVSEKIKHTLDPLIRALAKLR